MARVVRVAVVEVRKRGRPRLGNCRIECMIPAPVFAKLIAEERRTGTYRTRIAANVLCHWANKQTATQRTIFPS